MSEAVPSPESTPAPAGNDAYDAASISVLKGLEAVRKRPGMYIGDTDDGSGLHHMAFEIIDNAVDEAQAGFATACSLTLNGDGSVTVRDDGRGIPTDMHVEEGVSAAEVVLTRLHAGGKFNQNSYKVSGGLHGVGAAVVNALSEWMLVRIWRHGQEHVIRFEHGETTEPLHIVGPSTEHNGTEVTFMPSSGTFTKTEFDFNTLERRLRELAFLNSGLRIALRDETPHPRRRKPSSTTMAASSPSPNGSTAARPPSSPSPSRSPPKRARSASASNSPSPGTTAFHEGRCSASPTTSPQRDGGTHLAGFRQALTRIVSKIRRGHGPRRRASPSSAKDMREGMTAILSVKVPDPKFSSQTKDKLVSSEGPARRPGRRCRHHRSLVRNPPQRSQDHHRQGDGTPPPPAKPPAKPAN